MEYKSANTNVNVYSNLTSLDRDDVFQHSPEFTIIQPSDDDFSTKI